MLRHGDVAAGGVQLQQGAADPQLPQGAHAGTIVAGVIPVAAIDHRGEALLLRAAEDVEEDLFFAVIAAVRGIVFDEVEHVSDTDLLMRDAQALAKRRRILRFIGGGTKGGAAVTATARSPSTSWATFSRKLESTPPEKATAALPRERRTAFRFSRFSCSESMALPQCRWLMRLAM